MSCRLEEKSPQKLTSLASGDGQADHVLCNDRGCALSPGGDGGGRRGAEGLGRPVQRRQSRCPWCRVPEDTRASLAPTSRPPPLRRGEPGLTEDARLCGLTPPSIKADVCLSRASASALVACCPTCLISCLNDLPVSRLFPIQPTPRPHPPAPTRGDLLQCGAEQVTLPKKALERPPHRLQDAGPCSQVERGSAPGQR